MQLPETRRLIADLRRAGEAVGRLAEDDTIFRAALDAARAEDAESFQRLLEQFKISLDCERVCSWFWSKECVLECLELCGPLREESFDVELIRPFTELIVKLTADQNLVERLADSIQERNPEAFQSLVKDLDVQRFCHLLCHWACSIRWRMRCEILCTRGLRLRRHFVDQLSAAGASLRGLLDDQPTFDRIVQAALTGDCEVLTGIVGQRGDCFWICEWICSWRCALVCLRFCRQFPIATFENPIDEMRAFAQATAALAANESAVPRLVDALQRDNVEEFSALIKELQLERFCLQVCHWICFQVCELFCQCICRPPTTNPLFTHIGIYRVDPIWADFTADGTTTIGDFAFTGTIPLRGILPDGTAPDSLEYRFMTEKYPLGGGPLGVNAAMIDKTVIGELAYFEWNSTLSIWQYRTAEYYANDPANTAITIQQQFGPPLTVTVNKPVKPDGWIEVPRENELFIGGHGRFVPTGGLANLKTPTLTNEVFDLSVNAPPLPLNAGDHVPPPPPPGQKSEKPHFKISFQSRKIGTLPLITANEREKIALSNTQYTYIRHPQWAGGPHVDVPVLTVDVVELLAGGCKPLADELHVTFTAYHPYLGSCSVFLEGPAPLPPVVHPLISADGEAVSPPAGPGNVPPAGQFFDISALQPCAYIVWLQATLKLTSGNGAVFGTFEDHMAFCKTSQPPD